MTEELTLDLYPAEHQRCAGCHLLKPVTEFSWQYKSRGVRMRHCRDCCKRIREARNANGKEATYYLKRRDGQLNAMYRRNYGIGIAEYESLFAAQNGLCAICHQPERDRPAPMRRAGARIVATKRLSIDHDHVSGKVRGLLCRGCNAAIGHAADDPARLRRAADYIEGWATAHSVETAKS